MTTQTHTNPDGSTVIIPDTVRIERPDRVHIGYDATFPESSNAVLHGGRFHGGRFHGGYFHGGRFRGDYFGGDYFGGGSVVRTTRDYLLAGPVGVEPSLLTVARTETGWQIVGGCSDAVPFDLDADDDPFLADYPAQGDALAERAAALAYLRTVCRLRDRSCPIHQALPAETSHQETP